MHDAQQRLEAAQPAIEDERQKAAAHSDAAQAAAKGAAAQQVTLLATVGQLDGNLARLVAAAQAAEAQAAYAGFSSLGGLDFHPTGPLSAGPDGATTPPSRPP